MTANFFQILIKMNTQLLTFFKEIVPGVTKPFHVPSPAHVLLVVATFDLLHWFSAEALC